MARKQFVSSKKNAPSRVVSSKEAALRGRDPQNPGDDDDDDDEVFSDDGDDASMNGGAESPVSSVPSSPVSSDDDDDDEDHEREGADERDAADAEDGEGGEPVAVQVMPASVGRGKQLRFPTAISRGKEARILLNGSDRDNSDSESYASVASDDEDDHDDEMQSTSRPVAADGPAARSGKDADGSSVASPSKSPSAIDDEQEEGQGNADDETVYPIKAFRARKRHRPDSGYFAQMSTHVRDCLLSIRDMGAAESLTEEAHHEFRRKLSSGTVERVPWKQVSPPPPAAAPSDSEKKVPKSSPSRDDSDKKRVKDEKEGRLSSSSKSSSRKSGEGRSDRKSEKDSRSAGDSDRKKEKSGKENDVGGSRPDDTDVSGSGKKGSKESAERSKSSKSSSAKRAEQNGTSDKAKCEDVLCAKCKKSVSEQNADEAQRKASVEAAAKAAALQAAAAQATLDAAAAAATSARAQVPPSSTAQPTPTGSFILPTTSKRDIAQMREEAGRLNDEARSLKHEGNRRGVADPGNKGQVAQARYYLRSSVKFFQNALLLADIKAAYREAGDERNARTYGDFCMQTLAQTSSLIESTVRKLRAAGNTRLVALGYKLTAIVELTIYRLQHVKLFSLYSNMFTPGRSPDSRQNGSTPPTNGAGPDNQDNAVKTLLLKEMEHTLRGFEMWQRFETCRVEVLPRITNPAVVDMNVLFEDLAAELGQS